jgi:hypothetical protein
VILDVFVILFFTDPTITNNFKGNISYLISPEKYKNDRLTIIDNVRDRDDMVN